jgi:hypothetical protein
LGCSIVEHIVHGTSFICNYNYYSLIILPKIQSSPAVMCDVSINCNEDIPYDLSQVLISLYDVRCFRHILTVAGIIYQMIFLRH